jgi:hypothetical protein
MAALLGLDSDKNLDTDKIEFHLAAVKMELDIAQIGAVQ